ncbi:MAG: zinc ABC transporter substrate-binding protein [Solirubrobacterales bacterium]|nr:zinc ABC transporter substrate-binding protein [Solirubrobacterales bacterium]
MSRSLRLLAPVLAALVVTSGCGSDEPSPKSGTLQLVSTTTQLADLARNVAGDRADVRGLLKPNADPHDYEVRPSDIDGLSDARVVLQSGGDLDGWLGGAVQNAGGSPTVIKLTDSVKTTGDDPHWWQDPRNAVVAVRKIRDALSEADPPNARAYGANANSYIADLDSLDSAVAACVGRIPSSGRKLVTTHDALGYYAQRYGIEVIGAVIPSLSTRGQPSSGETAELAKTIRRERVKTIFAESSVNPKVEQAIARESGASIGRPLYADTLGPKGSAGDTYVKSIQANTKALIAGFSQGTERCDFPALVSR